MTAIDGYTFSVDMQDRGVTATLRQMKAEASAMKSAMRSGFETIQQGEGVMSAYNFKITESKRQIENYTQIIDTLKKRNEELQKSADENGKMIEKDAVAYARNARQIENYQHQINVLKNGIQSARVSISQYGDGLESARRYTANLESITKSYSASLDKQGKLFTSNKTKAQLLKAELEAMKNQYHAEASATSRLMAETKRLEGSYTSTTTAINRVNNARKIAIAQLNKEIAENGSASDRAQELADKVKSLTARYNQLKSTQASVKSSITATASEMAKQATEANNSATKLAELRRESARANPTGLRRISSALSIVETKADQATTHTRAFLASARSGFASATIGLGIFTAGMGKSVSMASELQAQWVTTKNLLITSGEGAVSVTRNLALMQQDASKYSKMYGLTQKEIADQYTELVKRGYSSESALGSMKSMLEATRATGDDFSDVVKNASSALDAFGLRSENAAKMGKNTERVVNAMAYAADMTATNFQDLGLGMSYVSASASQAGFSVEQTSAALGELSNAGVEGTRAGTGLRKTINSLIAPTAGATAALKGVGLSINDFKDKSGSLKSIDEIFKTINQHTNQLTRSDRGAFFKAVFGTTGQQAAQILAQSAGGLEKNDQKLTDLINKVNKAEEGNGYVHQLAQKNMESTKMQVDVLKASVQDLAINMGTKLLPAVNQVTQGFSKWVASKEGQREIQNFSTTVANFATTIGKHSGSIISFIGGFATGLVNVANVAGKATSAIGKLVSKIPGLSGNGNGGLASNLGKVAGTVAGIVIGLRLFHTAISGVRAVSLDLQTVFGVQNKELKEQNSLMREMILLQKESLGLADQKATTNAVSGTTGKGGGGSAVNTAVDVATTAIDVGATGASEKAGAKAGVGFVARFLSKVKGAGRLVLGMFLPTAIIDALGAKGALIGTKILGGITGVFSKSKGLFSALKGMFNNNWAVKLGRSYGGSILNEMKTVFRGGNKIVPETFLKLGSIATKAFSKGFSLLNPRNWFSKVSAAAGEEGAKAGTSFIGKMATATKLSSKLGAVGKFLGSKLFLGINIASSLWDIGKAFTQKKDRVENAGKGIGGLLGLGIGGYFGGPAGAAIGSMIGESIGGKMANSVVKFTKGTIKTMELLFSKHGWSKAWGNLSKSWKQTWEGLGDWWDKLIGKKTTSKKKSSPKKEYSADAVESLGGNNYSKEDIANVKAMNKAIQSYTSSLAKLKASIRKNDPTKQLNAMNRRLTSATSSWKKMAKPIKDIGDAFKYLSRFTGSMAKYDAFKAMNNELPKLSRVLKSTKIGAELKKLGNEIQKSKIGSKLKSMDKEIKGSSKNWNSMAKAIRTTTTRFTAMAKAVGMLTGSKNGFAKLETDVKSFSKTLDKYKFGKQISEQANIANSALSGKKSSFVEKFDSATNSMTSKLKSFGRSFEKNWRDVWSNVKNPVQKGLDQADTAAYNNFKSIESRRAKFQDSFLKGWQSWINSVRDEFKAGFGKLPDYAASSMKSIVSKMNRGIKGVNAVISDFGGSKNLSTIAYADGTDSLGGHPGGHMIVNDSVRPHWKELVKFPNKPWQMFNERNVLIPNAPKGTKVLSGEDTHSVMSTIGVSHYADGTDDSDKWIDRLTGKNEMKWLKKAFFDKTSFTDSVKVVSTLGQAMAEGFLTAIKAPIKKIAEEADTGMNPDGTSAAPTGDHKHWMKQAGIPSSWYSAINYIANHESGWRFNATNRSSGAYGIPQALPGSKMAAAGKDWRTNAITQLKWMKSYVTERYGGAPQAEKFWKTHHWYANGGFPSQHMIAELAEGDLPEAVIPLDISKRPRAKQLLGETINRMETDGGGSGIKKADQGQTNQVDSRLMQVINLLGTIAGLSQQQIDAITSLDLTNNPMANRNNRMNFYRDYGRDQALADYMRP
ncbi:phage tail tape measure protein [Limosilactobacillus fermentum]|uniref:phage tail tape measure protein n=1 Tax=Limosilactobacillus fermentum TaxID=1613 RepID=UPI0022EBFBC2|nr:phage tail tape measure protein [Limosilactobacillus fermentum]MDA3724082.1 phage tail tape measure protein [Limosilactobacillus fermentum]MDA3761027.1 phage tail tape measure protein [Limosilactobacillus fermentum]